MNRTEYVVFEIATGAEVHRASHMTVAVAWQLSQLDPERFDIRLEAVNE